MTIAEQTGADHFGKLGPQAQGLSLLICFGLSALKN